MNITMTIVSFSWIGIGCILSLLPNLVFKIVPASISTGFGEWKMHYPRTSTTLILLTQLGISTSILYHTWTWEESIWTGPVRWITCFTQAQLLPGRYTALVLQLLSLTLMLPVYLVQQLWDKLSLVVESWTTRPASSSSEEKHPNLSSDLSEDEQSRKTTFDDFEFHLPQKNHTRDESMEHTVD